MNTVYRIVMSDGSRLQRNASSAGEAIFGALNLHPGCTVKECHSGMTPEEAEQATKAGKKGAAAIPGAIFYEIPPHKPVERPVEIEEAE